MEKAHDNRFPEWNNMLALWMRTHFSDCACVVFHHLDLSRDDHLELAKKRFTSKDLGNCVHADYAVLRCASTEEAMKVCNETPDSDPFCTVWDRGKAIHENT